MRLIISVLSLLVFAALSYGNPRLQEQITAEIDALLIEGDHAYKIIAVSETTDGLAAVSLQPPYREFPNIILFRTGTGSSVKRIYEAFSIGIQDEPSGLLDLHTAGNAIDFTFDKAEPAVPDEKTVKKMIGTFEKEGGTLVWYGKFLHGHFGQRTKQRYFIDKSGYKKFAVKLLGEQYNSYPDQECTMYDTPNLKDVKFTKKNGKYHIEARTANNQLWTIAFKGVDAEAGYLIEKTISVEKSK